MAAATVVLRDDVHFIDLFSCIAASLFSKLTYLLTSREQLPPFNRRDQIALLAERLVCE